LTSAAYDRLANGYYNPDLKSLSNPGGLSGLGAVRANWTPMFQDFATVAGEVATSADTASAAASSAVNAPGTSATSVTNMAIPAAIPTAMVFALQQLNKAFVKGQTVVVSDQANALNSFTGPITAFNPADGSITVDALFASGAGAHAAWNIGLSAPIDNTLTGRVAALELANAQLRDTALFFAKEFI
jgi:hypothetical protein